MLNAGSICESDFRPISLVFVLGLGKKGIAIFEGIRHKPADGTKICVTDLIAKDELGRERSTVSHK